MTDAYYKPCKELELCNELIETYFNTKRYKECFDGHLTIAEQGYPLAECQVGSFYYDGLGVERNLDKAVYWTRRAADHGDRDGQCNLAWFHEDGIGVERDLEQAGFWYKKAALQGHDLAIQKCMELGIDWQAPRIDRETIRKDLKCRIYPLNHLERYKYVAVCTSYQGKWVLSRHKKRNTWETQGGHIEPGETPIEAARRELFEESGIQDAVLYPVCDYWGFDTQACSNGVVFLAIAHHIGQLPESEMAEMAVFDSLPADLTYPNTTPVFCNEADKIRRRLAWRTETENLILQRPSDDYAAQITEYRREFLDVGDSMDGCGSLRQTEDAMEYIRSCRIKENIATVPTHLVPGTQFFLIRKSDSKIIGMLQVRHYFNEYLEKYAGHIGYSVRPSERRKGYAKQMLHMALPFCLELGIRRVLICCLEDNMGSERTIRANGGVYESTVENNGRRLKRFWIEL
ncbi:MAG: GNAT family N-acetyltransferase [Clostridia bacterium]|nr:GNAT family N-acetyltransferase [Clostridia bacterium]